MRIKRLNILFADDDMYDCLFFNEAIEERRLPTQLSTLQDGVKLTKHLNSETNEQSDVLFPDLHMPRKNRFDCLSELKGSQRLQEFPVINFSTSFKQELVNYRYKKGARYFIRKPSELSLFNKKIIKRLLHL